MSQLLQGSSAKDASKSRGGVTEKMVLRQKERRLMFILDVPK